MSSAVTQMSAARSRLCGHIASKGFVAIESKWLEWFDCGWQMYVQQKAQPTGQAKTFNPVATMLRMHMPTNGETALHGGRVCGQAIIVAQEMSSDVSREAVCELTKIALEVIDMVNSSESVHDEIMAYLEGARAGWLSTHLARRPAGEAAFRVMA